MYDCGIKDEDIKRNSRFGFLCAVAEDSYFTDCKVSKSTIEVINADFSTCIGGLVGESISSNGYLLISNCTFEDGYIHLDADWHMNSYTFLVGGILGFTEEKTNTDIKNCYSSGKIKATNTEDSHDTSCIGCIAGLLDGSCRISGCVSSMDIDFSYSKDIGDTYLCGIASSAGVTYTKCVYLGTISAKVKNYGYYATLHANGIAEGQNIVKNCAFYGKFDINWKGTRCHVAGIAYDNRVFNNGKDHNIVYSEGNNINFEGRYLCEDNLTIAPVCYSSIDGDTGKKISERDYYSFKNSGGKSWYNPNTADEKKYQKTHEELKADDFIKSLNDDANGNIWGKLTGMSDERLNGLPMPVVCGGVPTSYTGDGTLNNPYMINTEDDLSRLKDNVNDGGAFENIYFKLGSDINMSGIMDYSIGFFKEKPFKGHLDGNGHAIVGLRNNLFGYMYGTVKNLALIDCNIESQNWTGALAEAVGDENNKAEVSNCYVSGVVQASGNNQILLGGICGNVANGSSVHDSYFKGHLVVKAGFNGPHIVGGIAGNNGNSTVDTTNPKGIYNCYASFEYHKEDSYMSSSCFMYGISSGAVEDCYVVTPSRIDWSNPGCTVLNSESELNDKFQGKVGWIQGVYRPLLASAKHYEATSPEGTTAYFDAIPEANPKKNFIYNVTVSGDPYADKTIWQLPNMAVYVPSEQTDYITNGYLDQSSDFQYNRTANATKGQLRYDLKQNASGYHIICLPGVVERGDLPKDGKVMIYGKITTTETSQEINEVHVDTIPAGVPCILYVPTAAYAEGTDIPLVMRGEIRKEPLIDANYSNMKGTFKTVTNVNDACITATKREDGNVYFEKSASAVTLQPFTAWLEGATGDVKIVDYILLDEENSAMTVTLANLNEQTSVV